MVEMTDLEEVQEEVAVLEELLEKIELLELVEEEMADELVEHWVLPRPVKQAFFVRDVREGSEKACPYSEWVLRGSDDISEKFLNLLAVCAASSLACWLFSSLALFFD